jgi:hypothetical protein
MPDTPTTPEALAAALDAHNRWRRDDDGDEPAPNPTELGRTIDAAAGMLRTLSARVAALEAERAAVPSAAVLLAEQVLHMDMVTERGVRARDLARQVLDTGHNVHEGECAGILRDLASMLGAGGYNASAVDPAVFREKILWGINQLQAERAAVVPAGAVAKVSAETVEHLRKQAWRMLDYGKGRNVQIDANTLLDLLACVPPAAPTPTGDAT